MYPKTLIPRCRICKREMPLESITGHLPYCIDNTIMFDCEGRPTERAELIIDTLAEYYCRKKPKNS